MKSSQSQTILIVDDTEGTRYVVGRILQKAGYSVREAHNAEDGLRLALDKPDLIILDVNLPDMSGYEVCRRIKSDPATSFIPVLHLSASMVESESRSIGLEEGADGYLTYPVEPRELVATIQALFRVRAAERLASEQRELLQVTLNSIGDGVIATDTEGLVTFMNPVAESLTGWGQDEAIGKSFQQVFSIIDEQTRQPEPNPIEKVLREGKPADLSNRTLLIARSGSERSIDDRAAPIRGAGGKVGGVVVVFQDVTERRRTEKEITRLLASERRQSEKLRQLTAASLGIHAAGQLESALSVIAEEARRIIGAHQATTSISSGETRMQTLHAHSYSDKFAAFRSQNLLPEENNLLVQLCHDNHPMRFTHPELEAHPAWPEFASQTVQRPPLRGWLAAPLISRSGKNVGFIQLSDKYEGDFTEEDEIILLQLAQVAAIAAENARLYDALRETDRLKDEFLAMLAHELRNPLAPIQNAVQVLRMRASANDETRWAIDVADRQVRQLSRLVDDLLDVSRISRGKIVLRKEALDLAQVVARAVETSRPQIESRQHQLTLSMPSSTVRVEADAVRLAQVFWNLLINAAKYTPNGGHIRLDVVTEGEVAVVRVRDTGVGISTEMLPRVFDLFAQVDHSLERSEGGLGIGLTLVRRLTEMHGGTVQAFSEGAGKGSEFIVRLPCLREDTLAVPDAGSGVAKRANLPALRIVVVDDNRDSAISLALLLRLFGNEVRVAHDGIEAWHLAEQYRPDMVLLDIGLPGMNGYDVARRIRSDPVLKATVLVALTGYGSAEDTRRSQEAGFNLHLVKPVDLVSLQTLLASLAVRTRH